MHLHSSATHTSCPSALTDPSSQFGDGARGREHPRYHSSHPSCTTGDTRSVAALPQHTQLGTSTSSRGGWAHTCMGQYTALVGPSLDVFFQASVLLAVLLIATLLLLTPQVLPTRCAPRVSSLNAPTAASGDTRVRGRVNTHCWVCTAQLHRIPLSTAAASHHLHAWPVLREGKCGCWRTCPHAQPGTPLVGCHQLL